LAFKSCDLELNEAVTVDGKIGGVSGTAVVIYLEEMLDSEIFTNNLSKGVF
jgi:hypothetical protein